MADKTKISINVSFDKKVALSHVASSQLQKEKPGPKLKKTLGTTKPSASVDQPVLHWDETTDPINNTVTLAIREVTSNVVFSARIWVDKSIDRKHACYGHVMDHEKRHVKVWQSGVRKYAKDILKAVEAAVSPDMAKPVEVKQKDAKKLRADSFTRIETALNDAVQIYGKKIGAESKKKIHTAAEARKTQSICADYLI